jgi:tetratricopeptide (TPR) repeat protein
MTDDSPGAGSFFAELKRRRVIRVGLTYAAAIFILLQVADLVFPALGVPDSVYRFLVITSLLGFPLALVLAWVFDITPEGVRRTGAVGQEGEIVAKLRPWVVYGGSIVAVLLVVALGAYWARPRSASGEVTAGADVIAVLPFETSGPGLEEMGEGMVDLLSRNLDEVGAIRTVETRTVLSNWRQRAGSAVLDLAGQLSVGRDVEAGSILIGSIVAAGAEVRISGDLYSVSGVRLASVSADGSSEELLAVVDSLSLSVLREIWQSRAPLPRFNVSAITTGDPEAIRAYLEGAKHYRASRWEAAERAFNRAVAVDSTFASAHYMLVRTLGWVGGSASDRALARELELARRYADRLPVRERTLLRAEELAHSGRMDVAMDTLRSYLDRYPNDPEAMFELADDEFHVAQMSPGLARFEASVLDRIRRFDAVLDRDPSFVPALIHPLELSLRGGDTALIRHYVARLEIAAPTDTQALRSYRAAANVFYRPDDVDGLIVALDLALRQDKDTDLRFQAGMAVTAPLTRLAILRPAAQQQRIIDWAMTRLQQGRDSRTLGLTLQLLIASGRLAQAIELLETSYPGPIPDRDPRPGLALTPAYLGYVDDAYYERGGFAYLREDHRLGVRMLAAIDAGDRDALRVLAAQAREQGERIGAPFLGAVADAGEGFLRALNGEPPAGLGDVESALNNFSRQSEPYWFRWLDWMSDYPETRARALAILKRPWGMDPEYDAPRQYLLGRALAAEGESEAARQAYQTFIDLLADADPGLRVWARVDSAVAGIAALSGSN